MPSPSRLQWKAEGAWKARGRSAAGASSSVGDAFIPRLADQGASLLPHGSFVASSVASSMSPRRVSHRRHPGRCVVEGGHSVAAHGGRSSEAGRTQRGGPCCVINNSPLSCLMCSQTTLLLLQKAKPSSMWSSDALNFNPQFSILEVACQPRSYFLRAVRWRFALKLIRVL